MGEENRVAKQEEEGIRIIRSVMNFLGLFLPVTLAKRVVAMIMIALGTPNQRVTKITGLCDRSVRSLKKALREEEVEKLLCIQKGSGRKSKTAGVEEEIFAEIDRNNYHTRQQVADMIEEKFHIYSRARRFIRTFSGRKRYNVLGALDFVSKKVLTVTLERI